MRQTSDDDFNVENEVQALRRKRMTARSRPKKRQQSPIPRIGLKLRKARLPKYLKRLGVERRQAYERAIFGSR